MKRIHAVAASVALSLLAATPVLAAPPHDPQNMQLFLNPQDLSWENAPPSLPKGATLSVLYGDPHKKGPFVMRITTPASYTIPPHWHSKAENLTVISGTLHLGDGDHLDQSKAQALLPGGFHYLPAKSHHFAFTKGPAVVQIHGEGPFDIFYINPKDDPRRQQPAGR